MALLPPYASFRLVLAALVIVWLAVGKPSTGDEPVNVLIIGAAFYIVARGTRYVGDVRFLVLAVVTVAALVLILLLPPLDRSGTWVQKIVFLSYFAIGYCLTQFIATSLRPLWSRQDGADGEA